MNVGQVKDELASSDPSWNVGKAHSSSVDKIIVSGNYTKAEIELRQDDFAVDFYNESGSFEKTEMYPNIKSLIPDLKAYIN